MASCARNVGAVLTVVEGSEGSCSSREWRLLYEEAQACVAEAEARAQEYRWAEVRARGKAASWKAQFESGRAKRIEAREETKAVRRTARDALSLQAEVEQLKRLLSAAGMSWRSTPVLLRRRVGQLQRKNTEWCRKNATLRRSNALLRRRNAELRQEVRAAVSAQDGMSARIEALEAELAALRASRAVLSKTLYGRKSERQERPHSDRRRGQQPGVRGHGRTARPGLEQRDEVQDLAARARRCSGCGTPYVANGDRSTEIVEIEVRAHRRRIVRPRWRRACDCEDSPQAVIAPAPHRLYPRTSYGTSVWACVLFERYVCHRPLNGVAGWLTHQGLAVSAGTLAGGIARFAPLFEPLARAILDRQKRAAVRHGDETGWRIQALRQAGRSGRAWLWVSVTGDAVYFHIDPSRSAEAALTVFGGAAGEQVLVVDRLATYKKLARLLEGRILLSWCWVHHRRDFIAAAAGQAHLTDWCRAWLQRVAAIYRLNRQRLARYEPGRQRPDGAFADAQQALEAELESLFATAEGELAALEEAAIEGKPLRSLLNHRAGLCVFLERPDVPMDNNFAERTLRGAVIGRRLSFGSDSEAGARFTALMYTVMETLALNGIDVHRWLREWLSACAAQGARAPPQLDEWLPWSMSPARRREWMAPG